MTLALFCIFLSGCSRTPLAPHHTAPIESKPLLKMSQVDQFLETLELYFKSCASGMRGLGSDRDPSNIGSNLLGNIRSDSAFITENLLSQSDKSQDISIIGDFFPGVLSQVTNQIRRAIVDRRIHLHAHGWLAASTIPIRLSLIFLTLRLFRNGLEMKNPQFLKDAQSVLLLTTGSSFLNPYMPYLSPQVVSSAFILCKASPAAIDDDWICIRAFWRFIDAVYFIQICHDQSFCTEHEIPKLQAELAQVLIKAAETPKLEKSQTLWTIIFNTYMKELESGKPPSQAGHILVTELSPIL